MDALIINPNTLKDVYQNLNELVALEPPIWAGLLANYLRRWDYSVAILDAEAEGLTIEETVKRIPDYDPRLIVLTVCGHQPSASTQSMSTAGALCQAIKTAQCESKVLLIGNHISALPNRTVIEETADFVCQGEGPLTINGLLSINLNDPTQYGKVPGLWYKNNNTPCFTHPAPLIQHDRLAIDLPGVAYDLLPMEKYRAHNWHCFGTINDRQPYASLYTSLGCPFHCEFCCINAIFGKPAYRSWDPLFIVSQFDLLANKYNIKNIKIADEMFVLNEDHFLTVCRLLAERSHGLNIWAYARVDTVKPAYLDTLKAAGINWLALGIESGSQAIRNGVRKGRFGKQDIRLVVRDIREAGINVIGNFIFGLPDDSLQTMQETLALAIELRCEMANFYSAMAYPGSQLYDLALKNNWVLPETWSGYSQHAYETLPLATKYLTSGQVLAFRDYAWQTYFTNPSYLSMIKRKFGKETHNHISKMTQYILPRKYSELDFIQWVPQERTSLRNSENEIVII